MKSTIQDRAARTIAQDKLFQFKGLDHVDPELEVLVVRVPDAMAEAHKTAHDAKAWATGHVTGMHLNLATLSPIQVSSKGLNEAIDKLRWPREVGRKTLAAIPGLVRHAVPIQAEPDNKGRKDILVVHTLIAPLEAGGTLYRARLVVRTTPQGHHYYGHHLEGLGSEMPGAFCVGHTSEEELGFTPHPGTLKISHLLAGFKPHRGE